MLKIVVLVAVAVTWLPAVSFKLPAFVAGQVDGGAVEVRESVVLATVAGTAERCGTVHGTLFKRQITTVLPAMFAYLLSDTDPDELARQIEGLAPRYQRELAAMAEASGVSKHVLGGLSVMVDMGCTVLVTGLADDEPVRMARNMDYAPVGVIGPMTVVQVIRQADQAVFASVGWPGYAGVISGMNEYGLCAAVLVNQQGDVFEDGTPLPFVVRGLLEGCQTVDAAWDRFQQDLPSTGHYIAICDRQGAAILWRDRKGPQRRRPKGDTLTCANEPPGRRSPRLRRFDQLIRGNLVDSPAALRRALSAVHGSSINAQAMVFMPEEGVIQLAIGTAAADAVTRSWTAIDLQQALGAAGVPADIGTAGLGMVKPRRHYRR